MRAAVLDRHGGAAQLKIREVPLPKVGANDVLIRIDTAGVGSWDLESRKGNIETEQDFPIVLGTDGSGVVADVGRNVTRFRRGQRVWSYEFDNKKGGFYAEYAAVSQRSVGRVPSGLSLERAGALTVIGLTALQGVDALHLKRGETVIIHGASGSVGMLAVQLAQWRGARILATASGRSGIAFVRRLGIERVIDGKKDDIVFAARILAPEGVDAVLAFAGGDALSNCMDALRKGGRVVHPNGVEPAPRQRKGVRIKSYDAVASPEKFAALDRAVRASRLRVPIARTFALARATNAHLFMERGHVLGKVVLRP